MAVYTAFWGILLSLLSVCLAAPGDRIRPQPKLGYDHGYTCKVLGKDDCRGPEDVTYLGGDTALYSSNDNLKMWDHWAFGPSKTPDGGIFAVFGVSSANPRVSTSVSCP